MNLEEQLRAIDPRTPSEEAITALRNAARDGETPVFALRAPDAIDVAQETALPVLALTASRTSSPYNLESRGVLVATRLDINLTLAATWHEWKEPLVTGAPRRTPADVVEGFVASLHDNDLRARLPDLPWRPGALLVRAVVRDQITAPCFVTLDGGSTTEDPEVLSYLDWMAAQQPALPLPAPSAAVDFTPDEWTPAVPDQPGITLVLQRVSLAGQGRQLALRGSFNLPVAPHQLIAPAAMDRTLVDASLMARFSITLVFVSHGSDEPAVLPLHLSASDFSPPGPDGRLHARGIFRAELFAHDQTPRMLGRYSVYAFANEHMAGPYPLTLVGEELVPLVPPR